MNKELTIEQKAKAYDEAIKKAESLYKIAEPMSGCNVILETLFPELKESEGEKIRKDIIRVFKGEISFTTEEDNKKYIAWLEKQGEKDSQVICPTFTFDDILALQCCMETVKKVQEDKDLYEKLNDLHGRVYDAYHFEKQGKQETIDKVEPKFHKGDWIRQKSCPDKTFKISRVDTDRYVLDDRFEQDILFVCEDLWELESADKPKFNIGDWIIRNAEGFKHNTYLVTEVKDYYVCEELKGKKVTFTFNDVHKSFKLWDIQDAKVGDVLVHNDCTFIFMGIKDGIVQAIDENFVEPVNFGEPDKDNDYHPATNEQRELLFEEMHKAGYVWDVEKKELKKINSYCQENCKGFQETGKCFADGECKAKREAEQKPAWSEEDECYMSECIGAIATKDGWSFEEKRKTKHWLNSLKDRVQPKQEWSEEDEKIINGLIDSLTRISFNTRTDSTSPNYTFYKEIDWLKSLRPQWKPSDEQLKILHDVAIYIDHSMFPCQKGFLMKLYKQLKKLK